MLIIRKLNCIDAASVQFSFLMMKIQGVTGGTDQTSGECSLGQTIPI